MAMGVDSRAAPTAYSHRLSMGARNQPADLLPGTLDLLILRSLSAGPRHGYGIALHIRTLVRSFSRSARARSTRRFSDCC